MMYYLPKIASVTILLLMVNAQYASADDRSAAVGSSYKIDINADGKVSVQEALAAAMPIKVFENADADHNGYLNSIELSNALSIKQPPAAPIIVNDNAVTVMVKTALLQNPILKDLTIHVETENGIVQLTGVVSNQHLALATAQIATAGQVAAGVAGVQHVVNSLTVQS